MNQKDAIRDYITRFGSITPMDAFRDLGITKLATRVSEMRKSGECDFDIELEKTKTRLGHTTYYARYSFRKER